MAHQLEVVVVHQVAYVVLAAREIVIQTDHVVALAEQSLTKMGTDESGSARNQYAAHASFYLMPIPM